MKIYIVHLIFLYTFLRAVRGITIYDTRLTSGYSGTVEVLTHQGWLPVCRTSSSYWSTPESSVLCRQLGYDVTSDPSTGSTFSSSTSLEFDFGCSGNELQISECSYTLRNSDPSSSCSPVVTVTCSQCTEGSVQLSGGVVPEAGTVEFCSSGIWKAVCDSNWDYKDAFVVCRELGLPATEVITYSNSYFGDHPIPSDQYFNCYGNETSLNSCQRSSTTCDFASVAGIYCMGDVITALCTEGLLQLVGGRDEDEGRIEVCSNGVWGTIYAGNWDVNDATVVCRQLGYQRYSRVEALQVSSGYFEGGTGPVLFGNLYCNGMESRITDCSSSYDYGATHSHDAGVRCQRTAANTQICVDGDIRLVNGTTMSEGRVEICYAGIWGSVCDSSWDDWDAAIVCLQLGFQGANATALSGSHYGDGDGPYHLNGVDCSGEERMLLQCSHSTIGYHTCTPGHDAGVRCDASLCTHHQLRLFRDDSDSQYGVAEICIHGFWADICYSGSYTTIASKFCKEYMGIHSLSFGQSCCPTGVERNTGNLTLYSISCNGLSNFFTQDCTYSIVSGYSSGGCTLQNELIVGCYLESNCTDYDIRLVGGNSSLEGRVEMCYENLWGAITYSTYSYSWDTNDAMVACRQLGLPWEWALADQNSLFGQENGRIVARDFRCTGSEQRLTNCPYNFVPLSSGANYQSRPTASVICQGDTSKPNVCEHGDVHLVGEPTDSEMEGRVEFCAYGYWVVACDTFWNIDETNVVCKQLGFPIDASEYVSGSVFGSNYQLPLVGLSCGNGASHIGECQFYNQTSNCNHKRTVGIVCKERSQHYEININTTPEQDSYDTGSQVTLNCTATPLPHKYRDYTFPLTYHWYHDGGSWSSSSSSHTIITIPLNPRQSTVEYYCRIYRNDLLLGTGQTTLHVRSVLRINSTMHSFAKVLATQGQNLTLQVETSNHDIVKLLLELTWYHNNTVIVPEHNAGVSLSSDNKTLNITNFTSTYAGIYKAQFNQLFVHPYDEDCKNKYLSVTRNHLVLKPAVICVNINENDCSDSEMAQNKVTASVQNLDSNIQGTFPQNLSLKAMVVVSSRKELEHSTFYWYRSGSRIPPSSSLSPPQTYNSNLSLTQELHLSNITYEHTGKYEVLLLIDWSTYFRDSGCQSYYNRFVVPYLNRRRSVLAKAYTDVYYYNGLTFNFDADSRAATRDNGATFTCRASIEFPPFSTLSLIKNGQTVVTSSSELLQKSTRSVNTNPFGLYTCQLNASGAMFQKSYFLEEQAWLRMSINTGSLSACDGTTESIIKEALLLKITNECHCTFDQSAIYDSSINCNNGEVIYSAAIQYSNKDGSETASVIAERIVGQVPFSLTVIDGVSVTVTSACTDCRALTLTSAAGGGLFVGGFAAATLITGVVIVIIVLVIRKRRLNTTDTSCGETKRVTKVDSTRYAAPKVQKEPMTEDKKLTSQQRPHGNQRKAKLDPKAHYDTPRVQRQAAAGPRPVGKRGPPSTASQGIELSQEKDVYEAMEPEIYEETF